MTLIDTAVGAPASNEGTACTGRKSPITGPEGKPATAKKVGKDRTPAAAAPASVKSKAKRPATAAAMSPAASREKAAASGLTKADIVLRKLRTVRGVTIAQLAEVTGWQAHSVRGFLSAVVKKKLGLTLVTEVGKEGMRRYRIVDQDQQTSGASVGTGDRAGEA